MKLFTIAAALASVATLASAAPAASEWRARFYGRTDFKGGAIVDVRGLVGSSRACANIPAPGALSLQFEDDPPRTDNITVHTATACSGTGTTYIGPTSVPTFAPPVLSFKVNLP
ncbi:hypothetical protein AAF712_012091 [Marasmius tenuissimus]|uniref:Uncharacterized protein n=1 Tax=Marasmius tenuissimus TaxID=585030 RepID=A0ABR2ZHG9_9AGAR